MDLQRLIDEFTSTGGFETVLRNPLAQFGPGPQPYLGPSVLPLTLVDENSYREENIRYRSVVANDGTRYSPVQRKGSALLGSFDVKLAEQDAGNEMTGKEYDTLLKLLKSNASMDAMAALVRWVDIMVTQPLEMKIEKMRWECVVDALVPLRGDNNYSEDVAYSNPSGHRAAAGAAWSTDATDIFEQIFAAVQIMIDKGIQPQRFITSRRVVSIMGGNDTVRTRTNKITVDVGGQIVSTTGRATRAAINGALGEDGLPPIETYDLQYRTQVGTGRFLKDDVFVIIGATGRDAELDLGDDQSQLLPDTLGYVGMGRPAGQSGSGRAGFIESYTDKPPRIDTQGWQTSLPVVTEPEAIVVIHTIT